MDLASFSLGKRNFNEKRVKCQYPLGRKRIYDAGIGHNGIIDIMYAIGITPNTSSSLYIWKPFK